MIENSDLSGPGDLITAPPDILNLTVRNSTFHGQPPNNPAHIRGRALNVQTYKNLVVENNFFEDTNTVVKTSGYLGNGTPGNTLMVRFNRVHNIIGHRPDGNRDIANFVAVQEYRSPQGNPKDAEIAWNEVINEPGKSSSEDLINFYKAGGRADGWFKVHDNYFHGSYAQNPWKDTASGSGMIIDGPDHNRSAYIEAFNNIIVNTTNAGMNVAAGSHIWYHDNRVISTGKTPDGQWMPGSHAAMAIWDYYAGSKEYAGTMHDIVVENNVLGWAKEGYSNPYPNRNDCDEDKFGAFKKTNVHLPDAPITQAMEDGEHDIFLQRVKTAGITLGPAGKQP